MRGVPPGLDGVVGLLACPHCAGPLGRDGRVLRCPGGHAYDIARQGYASLLAPSARTGTADTADMVAARAELLAAGHFAAVTRALAEVATEVVNGVVAGCGAAGTGPGTVVDVGAGTGHHLAGVLDASPGCVGIALDVSRHAARRAARVHPRVGAVVADAWGRLPVRDGVAAVVLDVFAPRNGAEAARVLAPGGALLVVTPAPGHLRELAGPLGMLEIDEAKPRRLAEALGPYLEHEVTREVSARLRWGRADAERAAAMGPSAWHVGPAERRERASRLPDVLDVTLAVELSTWRRVGAD